MGFTSHGLGFVSRTVNYLTTLRREKGATKQIVNQTPTFATSSGAATTSTVTPTTNERTTEVLVLIPVC